MFVKFYESRQRKKQKQKLLKNAAQKPHFLKIGTGNQFVIYTGAQPLHLGEHLNFRNYIHLIVGNQAKLTLGNRVFLNNFCSLNCLLDVEIGENTLFGENVKIYDHNHKYTTGATLEVSPYEFCLAPVKIGKNCWLGSNVTVLKGVTIGDNSIIGAGCLIFKDIPANSKVTLEQSLNISPL